VIRGGAPGNAAYGLPDSLNFSTFGGIMEKTAKILLAALIGLGLISATASCKKDTAEKAGEKIDQAVQNTKDAAKDLKQDTKDTARDIKDDLKK
jgi:hypothetical protein